MIDKLEEANENRKFDQDLVDKQRQEIITLKVLRNCQIIVYISTTIAHM